MTLISFDLVVLVLKLEGLVWGDGVAAIRFEITQVSASKWHRDREDARELSKAFRLANVLRNFAA